MERSSIAMYSDTKDGDYYSSYSFAGHQLLGNMKGTLSSCLDEILRQRSEDDVITLADYGTADGGNVIDHMNNMIEHIRSVKGDGQEINIILEDQHLNDFNVLMQVVNGVNGRKGMKQDDSIHTLISGTSMYCRCLPRNTLDLGCSTIAVHWLSKWPVKIKAGITFYDADEDEFELIKYQASVDWKNFVINRGVEMKSGAYIFVIFPSDSERLTESLFRIFTAVCHSLLNDNLISQEEYLDINLQCYHTRPIEDLSKVFSDPDVVSLGLDLVSSRKYVYTGVPAIPKDMVTDATLLDHRNQMIRFIKAWMYNVVHFGLSGKRSSEEKKAIANEYFDRLNDVFLEMRYADGFTSGVGDILFKKK